MDYTQGDCQSMFSLDHTTRFFTALTFSPNRKFLGTHGICDPLSVGSNTITKEISSKKIFPNPNEGIFTLKNSYSTPSKIFIYNSLGLIIYNTVIHENEELKIDLTNFAKGVYFVKSNDSNLATKLILN
jgi:hypothetical protein